MIRLLTTSIGSFPFSKGAVEMGAVVERAVRETLRYDIPAIPQLPNPEEGFDSWMTDELKNPGKLFCADEFKKRVAGRDEAKIQSVGPATAVIYGGYKPDDAVSRVSDHLNALADGLSVRELYIFLDEPAIGRDELNFDYLALWRRVYERVRVLSGVSVRLGVHDCNDITSRLAEFFDMELIGVVAFNAVRYSIPIRDERESYGRYRSRGGRICWGVVDIRVNGNWAEVGRVDFRDGDLISHSCGYANLQEEDCEFALANLNRIKRVYLE